MCRGPTLARSELRLTEAAISALRGHLERQVAQIESLGDLYRDQGLVFASEVGTPINPSNLRKRSFARLLKTARLPPVRFHDLYSWSRWCGTP
jgi:hypothetical protein